MRFLHILRALLLGSALVPALAFAQSSSSSSMSSSSSSSSSSVSSSSSSVPYRSVVRLRPVPNSAQRKIDARINAQKGGKAVDGMCMSAAVDTRDSALMAAWSRLSTSMANSMSTRKAALMAAWTKTTTADRKQAVQNAWKTFKDSRKDAVKKFRDDQKTAWKTFKDTAKNTCKVTDNPELEGEGTDALGI